jgi:hypothetical protein
MRGRLMLGNQGKAFLLSYLDVGTGESEFTWQGIAGLGYSFHWGEILAAWRYIDYDMKSGSSIQRLSFSGPAIGVAFRW